MSTIRAPLHRRHPEVSSMAQEVPSVSTPAEIALVREHGGLAAVAVTGKEDGRVSVVTGEGRKARFTEDRILWRCGVSLDPAPEKVVAATLREFDARQESAAGQVDILSLWEVLQGEAPEWEVEDLAPLWLPHASRADVGVLLRAILQDGLRFRLKNSRVEVRTEAQVEEAKADKEARIREARIREAMVGWMKEGGKDPAPEGTSAHLQALKDLAASPTHPVRGDAGADLMEDADLTASPESAFRLLVDRGVFHPDENLLAHRHGLLRGFSRAARDQAEALPSLPADWLGARMDLRHLPAVTIDDSDTTEIDDALTVETLEDGRFRVGVHIADPGAWVLPGSPLDKEGHRRVTTVYLPERRLPMFPERLGNHLASLVAGEDRPAFSFLLTVDENGILHHYAIARSAIRVQRRLDYEGVDAALGTDPLLNRLNSLADSLREERRKAGALMTQLPEVSIKVDREGNITVKRFTARSVSREMVAEWMVWANHAAARWAWERRLPMPYRHQDAPSPPLDPDLDLTDVVAVLRETRKLGKTVTDRVPRRHFGLGIDAYVQVTSPIRRYLDLAVQRQLAASLEGKPPPLDNEGMRDLARHVEAHTAKTSLTEAVTKEYYLFKYLGLQGNSVLRALVLEDQGDRYRLIIPDLALRVPYRSRRRLQVGEGLWVEVQEADPRGGRLRLKEVDGPATGDEAPAGEGSSAESGSSSGLA